VNDLALAGTLVAGTAVAAGLLMVRAGAAHWAGWLTAAAGVAALLGTWLTTQDAAKVSGQVLLVVAWLVLLPAALWAYPQPRWRHAADMVLGVALVGPGVVACFFTAQPQVPAVLGTAAALALVAQTWWRLERSDSPDRRSLTWVATTASVVGLFSATLLFIAGETWGGPAAVAALAAVPAAMAIGVLRPEAIDVRGLAVASAVGVALGIGYLAYFACALAILELLGADTSEQPIVLALIGLVGAAMLRPAASMLRTVMDQMLFGDRPDPLGAASRAVGRIGRDPVQALALIREELALPYAALLRGPSMVAESGEPISHVRRVAARPPGPGEVALVVGMRPGDLRLSADDERVLRLLAPLLAEIVRGAELSADLQQSRAQALTAIADERRRLRRELHDGLGPALTGIAFTTDAARNLVATDPQAATDLLDHARRDTVDAIGQVREVVYGMRPPALDELGLVAALRQQSSSLVPGARFDVRGDLSELPAAVEVAAYRIVMEALANVARHTESPAATVMLDASADRVTIEVTDDGGASPDWKPGVGITSMRQRATELSGSFSAGPGPHGGRVSAVLPVRT
jgi:two-component system NarL family sensor kinase